MIKPSKLTSKFQTTIPSEIRTKLDLKAGDYIRFEENNGQITISKVNSTDWEYLNSVSGTLSEWSSQADEEAYADL